MATIRERYLYSYRRTRVCFSQREPQEKLWQLQKVACLGCFIERINLHIYCIRSQDFSLFNLIGQLCHYIFNRVVNMMAHKCTVNGGTVIPYACLPWLDFLALSL